MIDFPTYKRFIYLFFGCFRINIDNECGLCCNPDIESGCGQSDEEQCIIACCCPFYILTNILSIFAKILYTILYIFYIILYVLIWENSCAPIGRIIKKIFCLNEVHDICENHESHDIILEVIGQPVDLNNLVEGKPISNILN